MSSKLSLLLIVGVDLFILLYQTLQLSISYSETEILRQHSFLSFIINQSLTYFGKNDFALRLPMIIMHLGSVFFLYQISKEYLQKQGDRIWLIFIYLLLPGVMSAGIVVNSAGLVLFVLFVYLYLYKKFVYYWSDILLVFMLFIDKNFIYLYFALSMYFLFQKDRFHVVYTLILFGISYLLYGFTIKGVPSGHFLDMIGVYLAIFSPPIFFYFIYTLYRRFLQGQQDIVWYISATLFLYTFIVSMRQKVDLAYIAPYLIVSLPLVANSFVASYRIRLPIFRKRYKYFFLFALFFLLLNTTMVIANKELYKYMENPRKHFAYNMQVAKEIASELKEKDIDCVQTNRKLSQRIEFYGISECNKYKLQVVKNLKESANVTVCYSGREVFKATVTKINNK